MEVLSAVIARSVSDEVIQSRGRGSGLLRGACHRAALCADPLARNDGLHHGDQRSTTSSLITMNFFNSIRPKLVESATSAASRPVPIRMRPMRGWLWRGGRGGHPPRGK